MPWIYVNSRDVRQRRPAQARRTRRRAAGRDSYGAFRDYDTDYANGFDDQYDDRDDDQDDAASDYWDGQLYDRSGTPVRPTIASPRDQLPPIASGYDDPNTGQRLRGRARF